MPSAAVPSGNGDEETVAPKKRATGKRARVAAVAADAGAESPKAAKRPRRTRAKKAATKGDED